ncbi:DUF1491 family protein [Aestuariispira ectoiniformans]|mgnify:CR=1 FL=1|uniref:DUF1491 family protein n=1 Tax=Aestuariispira ectoiniformans TaxID=2775080 RepID=UPI00223BA5E1|nr:DUF1491 family protein [Aestuariispira ectoiniformans]
MDDGRLPTHLWVGATLRQLSMEAVPAFVLQKGDANGGSVLLKLNMLDNGCRVLTQARDLDGKLGWMSVFREDVVDEAKADDYIERARQRDPDLWVIEVEDRQGRNPFDRE